MFITTPNILTILRLLAAPCVAFFLVIDIGGLEAVLAFFIFVTAGVTDYLDGYLARLWNQTSLLGKVLDPIADKAMVIIVLSFLPYCLDDYLIKVLYGLPAIIIILREIIVSGMREYISGNSKLLTVTKLSKWKTTAQLFSIALLLLGNLPRLGHLPITEIGLLCLWFACLLTLITGIDYSRKMLSSLEKGS